ncbi:MAG: hypothetical protein JMN26_13090, partial [gamma proteobacterium endosymbiont of Lamellibrachia anaximandri]|nr:hypothetical protein [gamma proteobacterium endosymbiont of Lamellibrachia anaximandri]
FPLWRKARRVSSAASRLPGTTSLRFALHGWQRSSGMQIMDDVMQDIETAFFTYGITEEQEKEIIDIVQLGVNKSQVNLEQGLQLNQQLRAIIDRLAQFSSM